MITDNHEVIRPTAVTVPPAFQLLIQFVEHDVRQRRGDGSALRTPLCGLFDRPVDLHSGLQRPREERDYPLIADLAPNEPQDQVMGDLVEKSLQVDRRTPLIPLQYRLSQVLDGLMLALATAKAKIDGARPGRTAGKIASV